MTKKAEWSQKELIAAQKLNTIFEDEKTSCRSHIVTVEAACVTTFKTNKKHDVAKPKQKKGTSPLVLHDGKQ